MTEIMTASDADFIATQLRAPKGYNFRVIITDFFDGPFSSMTLGNFRRLERAIKAAKKHSGSMKVCDIYDREGRCVASFGSP